MQAESKQRNSEHLIGLIFITEALILQLKSFLQLIGSNELLYNRIYATIALIVIIASQYWHCNCDWKCTFKSLTSNTSVMRKKTPNLVQWNFIVIYHFLNTTAWPTCCRGVVRACCSLRTRELRLMTQLAWSSLLQYPREVSRAGPETAAGFDQESGSSGKLWWWGRYMVKLGSQTKGWDRVWWG